MSDVHFSDDLVLTSLGEEDHSQYHGAVVPPVFMNSLHVFDTMEDFINFRKFDEKRYVYGRTSNPTVSLAERKIAALEHGAMALCFASGMAASSAAVLAICRSGSHVICIRNIYGPLKYLLDSYLKPRFGVDTTYVSGTDLDEIEAAIRPETAIILIESPTSIVLDVLDIRGIVSVAKKHGIKTYIDNSYSTPIFQKPLDMGIDIVMHTASKYLAGHSDLLGGVLVSKDEKLMQSIASNERELLGGILGPMEGWLLTRGLRTLHVRVRAHYEAGLKVAKYLSQHDKVKKVNYPMLETNPGFELAKSQMEGATGLLSFELDSDTETARKFLDELKLFRLGVSWGGFESLKIMPFYSFNDEQARWMGTVRGLVRLHIGLEGTDNLFSDLENAFKKI